MSTHEGKVGELFFLLHPGEVQFSGYGLTIKQGSKKQLFGLLMVDRPHRASRSWLAKVERRYGRYGLCPMTQMGERGIACQMWIADSSLAYVKTVSGPFMYLLQDALFPLLTSPPNPQFDVQWDAATRLWKSTFHKGEEVTNRRSSDQPRGFALGMIVSTPGAIMALEKAGQLPHEFVHRHAACDWGDLDQYDCKTNEQALREGGRLLSAYSTKNGTRLWIITEADRSVTTLLLPSEY